jgi:hypothetical protein
VIAHLIDSIFTDVTPSEAGIKCAGMESGEDDRTADPVARLVEAPWRRMGYAGNIARGKPAGILRGSFCQTVLYLLNKR